MVHRTMQDGPDFNRYEDTDPVYRQRYTPVNDTVRPYLWGAAIGYFFHTQKQGANLSTVRHKLVWTITTLLKMIGTLVITICAGFVLTMGVVLGLLWIIGQL